MKVTINKIRVELQEVAEAHEMINSFFWGDFHRSWNEESLTYPLVCGYVSSGGSLTKNLTNVPLTIVVADKVFKDYSSLNDTESDTLQVCRHIFNTLNMSPRWNALIRVNSASVEKFIDRGSDEIAGHILNMNVDIKDSYSICNLPMGDYDFESTAENGCAGVLIVNSDGTFSFTAPSGSVVDLPDTPVTVLNESGDEVGSGDIPSVTGGVITVPDCPASGDGTAVLKDTDGNVLSTTPVAPDTTVDIEAPDSTTFLNLNSSLVDGWNSPSAGNQTLDVNLVDGNGDPVTPDDVSVAGRVVTVELPSGGAFPMLPSGTYTPKNAISGAFDLLWTGVSGDCTTGDGFIEKVGADVDFQSTGYFLIPHCGNFELFFKLQTTGGVHPFFGLSFYHSQAFYDNLDFAWYNQSGICDIRENGRFIGTYGGANNSTIFSIQREIETMQMHYKIDGIIVRSVPITNIGEMNGDSSIYAQQKVADIYVVIP